nr:hypothetical protein GCM10020092_023590 [Actinoplanes digitatis]
MLTIPTAVKNAPDSAGPKTRTITAVSTNPQAPFTAAPSRPIAPLRALRRDSVSAGLAMVLM